jgi:hypothetical protein
MLTYAAGDEKRVEYVEKLIEIHFADPEATSVGVLRVYEALSY